MEVVRLLAKLGANVETPDNDGRTPAWIAAQNGHLEVVKLLAKLGANVETPKNNGCTPVFIAAQHGHAEVVRVLAERGVRARRSGAGAHGEARLYIYLREVARTRTKVGAQPDVQEVRSSYNTMSNRHSSSARGSVAI